MGERHGPARHQDGESRRICQLCCIAEGVLDFDTSEARAGTVISGNGKGVGGERVQGVAGVVEELERLIACVSGGGDGPQVLDAVDGSWAGDVECQTRGGKDSSRGDCEGNQRRPKRAGEHVDNRGRSRVQLKRSRAWGGTNTNDILLYHSGMCVNGGGGLQWLTAPRVQDDLGPETTLRRRVIPRG